MNKATCNPWTTPAPVSPYYSGEALRAIGVTKAPLNNNAPALRPGEWIENQPLSKQFVAQIINQTRTTFVATPGELQTLKDSQAKFDDVNGKYLTWSPSNVEKRFFESRASIGGAADDVRLDQSKNLQLEAVARRESLKKEMRVFSEDAHDILRGICERLQTMMANFAKGREKQERAEAEKFGIAFQPSTLLVTAWQASWRIGDELPDKCLCFSPKQIASQLPVELDSPAK